MIWIYNSAFVILWLNVEVIRPERIIFCPRRRESCMDLLDFQRHCPAIVGYSSAVQMASRPTAMHRDSQMFRWKAPVPGILRGWNCTTNLRGPWTLMTMSVLVLPQSFKDWVFFSWCVTPGFLQTLQIQKFCASLWPRHQKQNILLQNSATQQCLHWTLRKCHQHQLVQSAQSLTEGRSPNQVGNFFNFIK